MSSFDRVLKIVEVEGISVWDCSSLGESIWENFARVWCGTFPPLVSSLLSVDGSISVSLSGVMGGFDRVLQVVEVESVTIWDSSALS